MAMGTKDYNRIAYALKSLRSRNKLTHRESTLLGEVALDLASYMQSCNSRFSMQRFLEAAGHPSFEED